ncbi:MAG: imidazole glycerol phosphate synthase subunit HisH [Micropepsaceae bacterium]
MAIIDYGSGNLRSVEKAMERAVADAGLDARIQVTSAADEVRQSSHIVLPGVGAFADCMKGLSALPGMIDALTECALRQGKPFLGICVGMQLMATVGREHGDCAGLGWIGGAVVRLSPTDTSLKVPHMGWNELKVTKPHPVLSHVSVAHQPHAYFVHSFHFVPDNEGDVAAVTVHGGRVVAAVARDNLIGTQFHPEKSQAIGLQLLERFVRWRP